MKSEKVIDVVFLVTKCNVKNWVETVPAFVKPFFSPIHPALLRSNSNVRKTDLFKKAVMKL